MKSKIINQILENIQINEKIIERCIPDIEEAIKLMLRSVRDRGKIFWCGNGGSAATAQNLSYDLMSGVSLHERKPIPSIALTTDASLLTAFSDESGLNSIFSHQVQALGDKSDVLVGISNDGDSKNIISAFRQAKFKELKTITFSGDSNGQLNQMGDVSIKIPTNNPQKIQSGCLMIGQIICSQIEDEFFLNNE